MTLIPMGVILLIGFWQGWMVNLSGSVDEQIKAFPDLISALHKDRAASVRSDVWRALFFVLAIGGFFYLYAKNEWKPGLALLIVPALILIDLVTVDKRYLPNSRFVPNSDMTTAEEPRPVDLQIMQDKDLSFRGVDFSTNPFQDAFFS